MELHSMTAKVTSLQPCSVQLDQDPWTNLVPPCAGHQAFVLRAPGNKRGIAGRLPKECSSHIPLFPQVYIPQHHSSVTS
jgi:hypothetical protein